MLSVFEKGVEIIKGKDTEKLRRGYLKGMTGLRSISAEIIGHDVHDIFAAFERGGKRNEINAHLGFFARFFALRRYLT